MLCSWCSINCSEQLLKQVALRILKQCWVAGDLVLALSNVWNKAPCMQKLFQYLSVPNFVRFSSLYSTNLLLLRSFWSPLVNLSLTLKQAILYRLLTTFKLEHWTAHRWESDYLQLMQKIDRVNIYLVNDTSKPASVSVSSLCILCRYCSLSATLDSTYEWKHNNCTT